MPAKNRITAQIVSKDKCFICCIAKVGLNGFIFHLGAASSFSMKQQYASTVVWRRDKSFSCVRRTTLHDTLYVLLTVTPAPVAGSVLATECGYSVAASRGRH